MDKNSPEYQEAFKRELDGFGFPGLADRVAAFRESGKGTPAPLIARRHNDAESELADEIVLGFCDHPGIPVEVHSVGEQACHVAALAISQAATSMHNDNLAVFLSEGQSNTGRPLLIWRIEE